MFIIEAENVSKWFGKLSAIDNLSFALEEGKILGLIGPNGSGKTTLFNLLTGFLKPEKGKIRLRGKDITGLAPYAICKAGIARTFQLNKPFASLTALENVMVGRLYSCNPARSMKQARIESEEILDFVNLGSKKSIVAGMLSIVDRKRLEIGRALASRPKVLLLDEMMAGLNSKEIEDSMRMVQKIRDSGITILVVEHVMKAILGISDKVMVLSAGSKIAEGTPREIITNRKVIEVFLGEDYYAQH